ncbi:MAG TPA: hypothetical protein VFS34_15575 [Thermoanaerobaculia bacterium]|nr:hypothetical protein [Thermoanaerobaculia bacterium]
MRFVRFLLALVLFASLASASPVDMMSTDVVVPGAGRIAGATGSFWVTDLWVRSPGGGTVTLEFHAMDSGSAQPAATAVIPMATSVVFLPDVLRNTFGIDAGLGNIRLLSTSPASATIRIYDLAGGGATYGMSFMGMPSSMAMGSFSGMADGDRNPYRYMISGLLPQPTARVNVMVVDTSSSPIAGTVEVLDADDSDPASGTRQYRFSIQPYSSHQFVDVLGGVESRFSGGSGLQVRIQLDDGSPGAMMAFASVMDNVSNDPYVVVGSMMDGSSSMMNGGMGPH